MQIDEYEHIMHRARLTVERLDEWQLNETMSLNVEYCPVKTSGAFAKKPQSGYRKLSPGEQWGNGWDNAWFRLTADIPDKWLARRIAIRLDLCGEMLVFDKNGEPLGTLSRYSIYRPELHKELLEIPVSGSHIELYAQVTAQYMLGMVMERDPRRAPMNYDKLEAKVTKAVIGTFDSEVYHYRLDLITAMGIVEGWQNDWRCRKLAGIIRRSLNAYAEDIANVKTAREVLSEALLWPAECYQPSVTAVGHGHLDLAWLWPCSESIQKGIRTFTEQLILMKQYSGYVFGASQPALYEWIKEHAPGLYEEIKQAVRDGRWEAQGGMYVEADTNITGAESLIRQFIYGKNFFMDEFGIEVKNLWLPDVFGYTGILPQIMKKSGCDYFLTTKLTWVRHPRFQHRNFRWRGIDGSEILTHIPAENTYNSILRTEDLAKANINFVENDKLDEYLVLFGIGDGGGGPCRDNIEFGLRQQNLAGAPKVKFGRADQFFERLNRHREELIIWHGELYFAMHRGTLTNIGLIKKYNRKLENLLKSCEVLYSSLPVEDFPSRQLSEYWKILLLNQFHDTLPGSAIPEVYRQSFLELQNAMDGTLELCRSAANRLLRKSAGSMVLFNPTSKSQRRTVKLPDEWTSCNSPALIDLQRESDGVVAALELPPLSSIELENDENPVGICEIDHELVLENELIRYEFNESGRLLRAYDKIAKFEVVLPEKPGNELACYVDRPNFYDAWDIDQSYREMPVVPLAVSCCRKIEQGLVRSIIELEAQVGDSTIQQQIILENWTRRIDFITRVDWHENHRMLRVNFPVNIRGTYANCDLGYGYISRPVTRNNDHDRLCFEFAAHQYIDISDKSYGAALLNDCKYGYSAYDSILSLNLLRSARYPDEVSDRMLHEFTYSFLPHSGDDLSGVIDEAMTLNRPPLIFEYCTGSINCPVTISGKGVTLEVLKRAEKSDAMILRLVEQCGGHNNVHLSFKSKQHLSVIDMLEWHEVENLGYGSDFNLQLKPFEILTLKMQPATKSV